jgi:glycosyltransferase involved in cell wall biosynthesis
MPNLGPKPAEVAPASVAQDPAALLPVSVLLLTYNEETGIETCLRNVCSFAADVVVLDSFSTDRTLEICRRYPCRIIQHEFLNFSEQRNWALQNIDWKYDWLLTVDADETFPEALIKEIGQALELPDINGYWINRRYIFLQRWIKYGGKYPLWTIRLYRRSKTRHEERASTAHALVEGRTAYLQNDIIHEDLKDLHSLLHRHNRYSTADAMELLMLEHGQLHQGVEPRLFGNVVERRRWIKDKIWPKLPFRPLLIFGYQYFFRLGFLDGYAGFVFCVLMGIQVFHMDVKLYEMRQRLARGLLEIDSRNVFRS